MATSDISTEIVSITGVTAHDASDEYIVSGQKYVVASIPQELMWSYASATAGVTSNPVTTNSTLTNTDSILLVKRGDFSASQASENMRGFLDTVNLTTVTTNVPSAGVLITFTKASHGLTAGKAVTLSNFVAVSGGASQDFFNGLTSQVVVLDANTFNLEGVVLPSSAAPVASTGTVRSTGSSLFAPSVKYPKFIVDDANEILVFPVPDASYEGKVLYVNYANVDDNSDLRNVVIFHACAKEFSKLSSSELPSISISALAPIPPVDPSISSPGVADTDEPAMTANVPTYTKPVQFFDMSQLDTFIVTNEDSELAQVQIGRLQVELGEYNSDIQNELNEFNKENARYQANIQAKLAKAQFDAQEAQKEGDLTLQAAIQEYTLKLQRHSSEVQKYQAEVASEIAEYQNKIQKQQTYSKEADKFYKWADTEVKTFIQNNSKMVNRAIAAQAAQQQAPRR